MLLQESYKGVKYRFYVPCSECLNNKEEKPSMIASYRIRKALNSNMPFIQCKNNFHIISSNQLQSKKLLIFIAIERFCFRFSRYASTRK